MFRQSPYYYSTHQYVFTDKSYDLSQNLLNLKLGTPEKFVKGKKTVSQQQFLQYFNRNDKQEGNVQKQMEEETKMCQKCQMVINIEDLNCADCNKSFCRNCLFQCEKCGQWNCSICTNRFYLEDGDHLICFQCSQQC